MTVNTKAILIMKELLTKIKKDIYHAGDKIKYTGNTTLKYGGLFYEFKILDGYKKGELGYTQKPPENSPPLFCCI